MLKKSFPPPPPTDGAGKTLSRSHAAVRQADGRQPGPAGSAVLKGSPSRHRPAASLTGARSWTARTLTHNHVHTHHIRTHVGTLTLTLAHGPTAPCHSRLGDWGGLLSGPRDCPAVRSPRWRAERRKRPPRTRALRTGTLRTHGPGRPAQRWLRLPSLCWEAGSTPTPAARGGSGQFSCLEDGQ